MSGISRTGIPPMWPYYMFAVIGLCMFIGLAFLLGWTFAPTDCGLEGGA